MTRLRLIMMVIGSIFTWVLSFNFVNAQNWQQLPGAANAIAVGGGSIWIIGTTPEPPSGYAIYRWNRNNWDKMPGTAERIAVDPSGNAWVITAEHNIYAFDGETFHQMPGAATDIAIGGGKVWVIGATPQPPFGYGIYRWNGSNWDQLPGAAERIAVDSTGKAWVVTPQHYIYAFDGENFQQVSGTGHDIAADTVPWVIGAAANPPLGNEIYRWNGNGWDLRSGGGIALAVHGSDDLWVIDAQHHIYQGIPVITKR